jgi:hypothetical protein
MDKLFSKGGHVSTYNIFAGHSRENSFLNYVENSFQRYMYHFLKYCPVNVLLSAESDLYSGLPTSNAVFLQITK